MQQVRVFPTLLYRGRGIYKGVGFDDHTYLGDVLNATRIYNDAEVDELSLLDIGARAEGRAISPKLVDKVATECMMPLSAGGGIDRLDQAKAVMDNGAEKVVLNTATFTNPGLVTDVADQYGNQAVVASVDAKSDGQGGYSVYSTNAKTPEAVDLIDHVREMESRGAGELLITSIDREGRREGYDTDLIKAVADAVSIPVIANGGAGGLGHFKPAIDAGAHALTAGSMFVFYGRRRAVLVNYPTRLRLNAALDGDILPANSETMVHGN
ncbi:HisA/HisF-related TIM barrel protein [Algimonas porphyrae]|uniref:Imidazole glycerol phosphate synthase subunit HisF n=1 Tax=Algimonas porphyrae TaxID=1128113 RepID=A0ABQ5V5L2_9PROT|nr:HisA/HisF-related TIM barrel protein [Algimonas porphyrae]GLQ21965.1 putative imidazole glycerol phosphate synthase subunit hisF2 [Algimonas porphyrae]